MIKRSFFQGFKHSHSFHSYFAISLCASIAWLTISCATSASEDEDEPMAEPTTEVTPTAPATSGDGHTPDAPHAALAPTGEGEVYYVRTDGIAAFVGPTTSSAKLQTFKKGNRVQILSIANGWAQIKSGGYIEESHISRAPVGIKKSSGSWHKKE